MKIFVKKIFTEAKFTAHNNDTLIRLDSDTAHIQIFHDCLINKLRRNVLNTEIERYSESGGMRFLKHIREFCMC